VPIIDSEHWGHEFFVSDGRYYLCVVCGTVGVFDVTVELTAQEFAEYERDGVKVIRALADQIRFRPNDFQERNVRGVYP